MVDNGIGVDIGKINRLDGNFGLFGIKERIQSLGGTYKMESQPSNGLHIVIIISL